MWLKYCKGVNTTNLGADRTEFYSTDHNQVLGAVLAVVDGSVIQTQSTTTYDGSDWALEITPYSNISSTNPLWLKLADIACKGGDEITVTARCRVNTQYGTVNDPVLVLDRGNCHGIETETTFGIEAVDTWYQASSGAKTVSGDADDDVTVELWIQVPYYVSGAAVYVDDIAVTGVSTDSDKISYWPECQIQEASGGGGGGLLVHPGMNGGING